MINEVIQGDCLGVMKRIPDGSVDMVLADLPYGTTECKWDTVIPFEPLWAEYERVIKNNGAIVLFGSEPFSSNLRMSNISNYKYDWVWDKRIPSGMGCAKYQPLRRTENISVFTKDNKKTIYNPQFEKRDRPIKAGGNKYSPSSPVQSAKEGKIYNKTYTHKHPTNLIQFDKIRRGSVHPTQKPVDLLEYLIKTYTYEGEMVLDNVIGSGTTAVAAINANRNFIGIEKESEYVDIARQRIDEALAEQNEKETDNE